MITNFLLVFGIVMIISGLFSYKQMKVTAGVYDDMRRKGELLVGEKRFLAIFISGVVALSVDGSGKIRDAVKISGMLPFRRVKKTPLPYTGKKITALDDFRDGVDKDTARIVSSMVRRYAK